MISHYYGNLLETTPILLDQFQVGTQKEVGHHNHQVLMVVVVHYRSQMEEDPEIKCEINLYKDYYLLPDYKVLVDILLVVNYSVDGMAVDTHQLEVAVFHHSPDSNPQQVATVGNLLQEVHPACRRVITIFTINCIRQTYCVIDSIVFGKCIF